MEDIKRLGIMHYIFDAKKQRKSLAYNASACGWTPRLGEKKVNGVNTYSTSVAGTIQYICPFTINSIL